MELCLPFTLYDFLKSNIISKKADYMYFVNEIISSVTALHRKGICHRDIKLKNFIFNSEGHCLIMDFGLSKLSVNNLNIEDELICGTLMYMPPELASKLKYEEKKLKIKEKDELNDCSNTKINNAMPLDVWSVGILLYTLLTRRTPYIVSNKDVCNDNSPNSEYMNQTEVILSKVSKAQWRWPTRMELAGEHPNTVQLIDDTLIRNFISSFLTLNPHNRPDLVSLTCHNLSFKEFMDITDQNLNSPPLALEEFIFKARQELNSVIKYYEELYKNYKNPHLLFVTEENPIIVNTLAKEAYTSLKTQMTKERRILTQLSKVEHLWLLSCAKLYIQEDTALSVLMWKEENHRRYSSHNHKFKPITKLLEGYEYGFMCDRCNREGPPSMRGQFHHCSCGSDLCKACLTLYVNKRTYTCNKVGKSLPLQSQSSQPYTTKHKTGPSDITQPYKPQRRSKQIRSSTGPNMNGKSVHNITKVGTMHDQGLSISQSTKKGGYTRSINNEHELSTSLSNEWRPFKDLVDDISEHNKQSTVNLPTDMEKRMLFNDQWIKYFHYLMPDNHIVDMLKAYTNRSVPANKPICFCYELYCGYIGLMFTDDCSYSSLHSVLFTPHPAVVEPFKVIYKPEDTPLDSNVPSTLDNSIRSLTLEESQDQYPLELKLSRYVAYINASLIKAKYSPGIKSHCPCIKITTTQLDKITYVSWVKGCLESGMCLFCLNTDYVQVFGPDYELRWFNIARKFMVRSTGDCDIINDTTFIHAPYIDKMIKDMTCSDSD